MGVRFRTFIVRKRSYRCRLIQYLALSAMIIMWPTLPILHDMRHLACKTLPVALFFMVLKSTNVQLLKVGIAGLNHDRVLSHLK